MGGDIDSYIDANRASWDDRVADHLVAYDAKKFADDPDANRVTFEASLMAPHLEDGTLEDCDLVHLQCHIGVDSISLARLGARVVGVDFSGAAIDAATDLARRAGVDATFVQATNEEAPDLLGRQFDVVYTSVGVLVWLPRLDTWAAAVTRLLRPGGLFFIYDGHPMAMTLQYDRTDDDLVITEPYFGRDGEPQSFDDGISYAAAPTSATRPSYEWPHPLEEIIGSLLEAGLRIESFREHRAMPWRMIPSLRATDAGYVLPTHPERLPLMFSIAARRPSAS